MSTLRSTLFLAGTVIIVLLTGFTFEAATRPDPLEAQSACGRFSGLKCQDECTRECSDGSCCSWSYYYYDRAARM
jgi:hypothetical protein